ncbi:epsin-1-like [Palaemon carinicauda]|uniref:epsin-1-like n=1 Tax=Palaemon carinicauda TaxID=392227 RepID=UPI0035B5CBE7
MRSSGDFSSRAPRAPLVVAPLPPPLGEAPPAYSVGTPLAPSGGAPPHPAGGAPSPPSGGAALGPYGGGSPAPSGGASPAPSGGASSVPYGGVSSDPSGGASSAPFSGAPKPSSSEALIAPTFVTGSIKDLDESLMPNIENSSYQIVPLPFITVHRSNDLAEEFGRPFENISSVLHYPAAFRDIKNSTMVVPPVSTNLESYNLPFTMEELDNAISLSSPTSHEEYNISYSRIFNLPKIIEMDHTAFEEKLRETQESKAKNAVLQPTAKRDRLIEDLLRINSHGATSRDPASWQF